MVLGRLGLKYLTQKQLHRKAESIFSLVEEITIWNLRCTECTKGERLWKYFENENAHMNGWFRVDPLAYYFVEFYPDDAQWLPCDSFSEDESYQRYEIVAYRKKENDIHYALRLHSLWPEDDFINLKHDNYDEDYWQETYFLASYKFSKYTEENHVRHWKLYEEMKEKRHILPKI